MGERKHVSTGLRLTGPIHHVLVALFCGCCATLLAVPGALCSNSNEVGQKMTKIPKPILAFFESSNRGDSASVVACFTSTAVLDDWGRHFEGHAGVASWDRTDNTGVESHLELVGAEAEDDTIVVTVKVRGNGFNGTGHMHLQLDADKIARLDIK